VKDGVSESDIGVAVVEWLADHEGGEARWKDIVEGIRSRLPLTNADRAPSRLRPGEEVWEQRVRNLRSHASTPGNPLAEGLLEGVRGGLRITEEGRLRAGLGRLGF
jgi:hypothetical protein